MLLTSEPSGVFIFSLRLNFYVIIVLVVPQPSGSISGCSARYAIWTRNEFFVPRTFASLALSGH